MSKRLKAGLQNGRVQVGLAIVCAAGVLGGTHLSRAHPNGASAALNEDRLGGAWELQSVGGEPVGANVESGVVAQKVTFAHGRVEGETRLLATSAAATTAMPFPDLSLARVEESQDGHDVTAFWNGTYKVLPNNRLELRIGKAQYKLAARFDPKSSALEMEQDAILTYKGAAKYRSAQAIASK